MAQRDAQDTTWICEAVMCIVEIDKDKRLCETHKEVYRNSEHDSAQDQDKDTEELEALQDAITVLLEERDND